MLAVEPEEMTASIIVLNSQQIHAGKIAHERGKGSRSLPSPQRTASKDAFAMTASNVSSGKSNDVTFICCHCNVGLSLYRSIICSMTTRDMSIFVIEVYPTVKNE
jgi:hypothetical protein